MKKIAISFLFALILQTFAFSQGTNTKQPTSYLSAELTEVRGDMSENERIERAVFELKKQPESKLAIVSYGLPGFATRRMNAVAAYYRKLGVSEDRFIKLYGGYEPKLRFQLWVVPQNAEVPKVQAILPSESYIFDRVPVIEGESFNNFDYTSPIDGFAKALQDDPKARASLVYYGSQMENFSVSLEGALKKANEVKQLLTKKFGIKTARISLSSGGKKEIGVVELRFVPEQKTSK
jgi:hypothetical protein